MYSLFLCYFSQEQISTGIFFIICNMNENFVASTLLITGISSTALFSQWGQVASVSRFFQITLRKHAFISVITTVPFHCDNSEC